MTWNPECALRLGAALMVACELAACSGSAPPSHEEVIQAVTAMMQSNYAKFASPGGGKLTVTRVQDLGCAASPDGRGWLCQAVIASTAPAQGNRKVTRTVRMVRSGAGWQAVME